MTPLKHGAGGKTKLLTLLDVHKLRKVNVIDLRNVIGTGPGGRALKANVLEIINAKDTTASSSATAGPLTLT